MRNRIVFYFFVVFIVASFFGGSVFTTYTQFIEAGPLTNAHQVVIEKGSSLKQVAHLLKNQGVIDSAAVFELGMRAFGKAGQIKAGEYSFPAQSSPKMAMNIITSDKTYIRKISVPEGYASSQIVDMLNNAVGLTGEIEKMPKNGTLLPDTYHYSYGDSKQGIINRMQHAMTQALAELWAGRDPDLPFDSVQDAVIVASIIEKETYLDKERPLIASAFINRLRQKMKLQSDPTVIFALTDGTYDLNRSLTYKDLKTPSPYNTYYVAGIPKGPISNPGYQSLYAVLHPADTNYIYFVANGTGGHTFAATYAQHQQNVQKWRAIQKSRK